MVILHLHKKNFSEYEKSHPDLHKSVKKLFSNLSDEEKARICSLNIEYVVFAAGDETIFQEEIDEEEVKVDFDYDF